MKGILLDPVIVKTPIAIKDVAGVTVNPATEETLNELCAAIQAVRAAVGTAADLRVTVLSGVVTTVSTVTTLTQIGGNPAICFIPNIQNSTYIFTNQLNIGRS